MRLLRKLNQAGDTIIEVMIVLAILGLAFAMSYATANRGLQQSRNAEEHSEALGLLSSQIELVRSAAVTTAPTSDTNNVFDSNSNFCLDMGSTGTMQYNTVGDTYPSACVMGSDLYQVKVQCTNPASPSASTPCTAFLATATWPGLGDLGQQQEQLSYNIAQPGTALVGFDDSVETQAEIPTVSAPTASPATGSTLAAGATITLSDTTPEASIYYTTDGTTPTTSSRLYAGPITRTQQVKAIAAVGQYTSSPVTFTYTLTLAPLTINLQNPEACYTFYGNILSYPGACSTTGWFSANDLNTGSALGAGVLYDISSQEAGMSGPATVTITYTNPCPPHTCYFYLLGTIEQDNYVTIELVNSAGTVVSSGEQELGSGPTMTLNLSSISSPTTIVIEPDNALFGQPATISGVSLSPGGS